MCKIENLWRTCYKTQEASSVLCDDLEGWGGRGHTCAYGRFTLLYSGNQYNTAKQFFVVQLLSHVRLFVTLWTAARQASLSFTISWSLLKLMSTESVMPFNYLILCHPFLLLPSIFPSIRVFSNELALCIRWPKYWSFSFSISPSNEYSGLISFKMDWFDLPEVQETLQSLLQLK